MGQISRKSPIFFSLNVLEQRVEKLLTVYSLGWHIGSVILQIFMKVKNCLGLESRRDGNFKCGHIIAIKVSWGRRPLPYFRRNSFHGSYGPCVSPNLPGGL